MTANPGHPNHSLGPFIAGAVLGVVVGAVITAGVWKYLGVSDAALAVVGLAGLILSTVIGMSGYANRSRAATVMTAASGFVKTLKSPAVIATSLLGLTFGQGVVTFLWALLGDR